MKPEHRRILYILLIYTVCVLALVFGLVFGLRRKKSEEKEEKEEEIFVLNLYNNTKGLIKKYPVINNIIVLQGLEEKIQNRLLTGFVN